jgi:hypothetical protein
MKRILLLLTVLCSPAIAVGQENAPMASKQVYEVRQYKLGEDHAGKLIDQYLSEVFLPALKRAGAGPVGIFAPAAGETSNDRFAVITYPNLAEMPVIVSALAGDQKFTEARREFESATGKGLPYQRIVSELLVAMDSMPMAKQPEGVGTLESRVYELRTYESKDETMGVRKVEMFNEGEVPIFLDSGIEPVFLGQAIAGPFTPSLTYLTAYPDDAARLKSWDAFRVNADWKVLSGKAKYQGTVSKIYKYVLRPLPGSEL